LDNSTPIFNSSRQSTSKLSHLVKIILFYNFVIFLSDCNQISNNNLL